MYDNSDLEKFISKSYAQSKNGGRYHENRHFRIWFLENSKKFKNSSKKTQFFWLKGASFQSFSTLGKNRLRSLHLCKGSTLSAHLEGGKFIIFLKSLHGLV